MLTPNNAAIIAYMDGYEYYGESGSFFATLGTPKFIIFASCWTLLFVLYLSLTSVTAYTRTDRPIGIFFNRKIAFAVDCLSAIFWFAGFIALALFYQFSPCGYQQASVCDTMITSVLVGVCIWYVSSQSP